MSSLLVESQYIPSIAYLAIMNQYPEICWDVSSHFVKQTQRSRCQILTAQGILQLSVPVCGGSQKTPMGMVRISYEEPWIRLHERSIRTAYGNAPFFEYYMDGLQKIWMEKWEYLHELNTTIIHWLRKSMRLPEVNVSESMSYLTAEDARLLGHTDVRNQITPKNLGSIDIPKYFQLFGSEFVPNLSSWDLLMTEGPNSFQYFRHFEKNPLIF